MNFIIMVDIGFFVLFAVRRLLVIFSFCFSRSEGFKAKVLFGESSESSVKVCLRFVIIFLDY